MPKYEKPDLPGSLAGTLHTTAWQIAHLGYTATAHMRLVSPDGTEINLVLDIHDGEGDWYEVKTGWRDE